MVARPGPGPPAEPEPGDFGPGPGPAHATAARQPSAGRGIDSHCQPLSRFKLIFLVRVACHVMHSLARIGGLGPGDSDAESQRDLGLRQSAHGHDVQPGSVRERPSPVTDDQ